MRLFAFKNNQIGEDNGIIHGEAPLTNLVSMFIPVCTVSYGLTFQKKLSNFLITLFNNILENQYHLIFLDKFIKGIL